MTIYAAWESPTNEGTFYYTIGNRKQAGKGHWSREEKRWVTEHEWVVSQIEEAGERVLIYDEDDQLRVSLPKASTALESTSMSGPAEKEPQPVREAGDPTQVEVFPFIHKDLLEREAYGREEYGGPLVTNDGRDNDWDAYQEALDLVVYLRKGILERIQHKFVIERLHREIDRLQGQNNEMVREINDLRRKVTQERNNTALVQERLDNAGEVIKTQRAAIEEYKIGAPSAD